MLVHTIAHPEGDAVTFFLRKQELAALFTMHSKKEERCLHFDTARRAVFAANNYAAIRLRQRGAPEFEESASLGVPFLVLEDSVKRMSATDFLTLHEHGDGFSLAVIKRPSKTWVPHEGTDWTKDIIDQACLVLAHTGDGRQAVRKGADKIEAVFPGYVELWNHRQSTDGERPTRADRFSFNTNMLDAMVKVGKATKEPVVHCYTPPGDLDPVLMEVEDESDACVWTMLLMPVRVGVVRASLSKEGTDATE